MAAGPARWRAADSQRFRKLAAASIGIESGWTFAITDFFEPFIIGKGIASGDFNNDLWPDLVLATDKLSPAECVQQVMDLLVQREFVS